MPLPLSEYTWAPDPEALSFYLPLSAPPPSFPSAESASRALFAASADRFYVQLIFFSFMLSKLLYIDTRYWNGGIIDMIPIQFFFLNKLLRILLVI